MQVIESKIEGRETIEVEPAEEPTKLVDLMAALQASVNAATSSRGKPVSVAEAKAAKKAKDEESEAAEAKKPARKRKTA
jgi:DNA end-binding protein Ku